jgi:hypothetical protein
VLVRDIVESSGLSVAPWTLFVASYGINLLLSVWPDPDRLVPGG